VIKRLGQPATAHDTGDSWNPTTDRVIACTYANDKLVVLRFGKPRSW